MKIQNTKERRSLSRKVKLKVIKWHMENGSNNARTTFKHGVERKQVRTWIKNEEQIQATGRGCALKFPLIEKVLFDEYKKGREEVKIMVGW